jgi:23S rRNA-/tRNA-specific pseudouridylate synthase
MRVREIRWVVRAADGPTVRDVLVAAGADPDAVRDGRVFVGRHRVRRAEEHVRVEDVVVVAPPRSSALAPKVLLNGGDIVAIEKPAGLPTIGDHRGEAHSLWSATARELGVDVARLHPTSRLDREVSGIVVFALTKAAASRLAAARASGEYDRRYVALACGSVARARGTWDFPIGRAHDPRRREVGGRDAVSARTHYAVCARLEGVLVLALSPATGRTHQLRVHAAHAGAPMLGDRTYGGPRRLDLEGGRVLALDRVALHAIRVSVPDARGRARAAVSPVPPELKAWWSALGGDDEAWELSASCDLG